MTTAVTGAGPDLLRDPLFVVAPDETGAPLTLTQLLSRLLTGPEVDGFPHLAAEQRGHWWRFLVRSAAKSLRTLDLDVGAAAAQPMDALAGELGRVLAELVPPGGWALYQPGPARPGLLQPPTRTGRNRKRLILRTRSVVLPRSLERRTTKERRTLAVNSGQNR